MDRIEQLEADRDERRKEVADILSAAETDKRNLSDEERERADTLNSELEQIQATLKLEKQRLEWDRTEALAIDRAPDPTNGVTPPNTAPDPLKDEAAFYHGFGQLLQAAAEYAKTGSISEDLAAATGLGTAVPSDGGFLVRKDYSTVLLQRAIEAAQVAQRCFRVNIGADADGIEWPMVDETSRATGSRWGGVRVYRRSEGDTVTASKPKLDRFDLRLEDLMGIAYTTDRAMADAQSLGQIITRSFTSEMAFTLDDEIINGTGAGQCLGLLNSDALVTQAKESGQVATTVLAENIINMRARLRARSRAGMVWFINQDIEPQLMTMGITVGSGGIAVWMPAGGLSASPFDRLFNRDVVPIEQCSTLGTKGDIIAADLGEYVLIDKGGIQTAESMHVRFLFGENTFRFTYRVNGAPIWKKALTPFKGTNTQSPFVTLATRA